MVTASAAAFRLLVGHEQRAMRSAGAGGEQGVVVGRAGDRFVHQRPTECWLRGAQLRAKAFGVEGLHKLSISSPMSAAGAECVNAPTLTTSTPAAANAGMRSRVIPPETS